MTFSRAAALGIVLALIIVAAASFWSFAARVSALQPPDPLPEADAIIVLTGGGKERLITGMKLLREGRGRRLLISGVHPATRDADLAPILGGPQELQECCVDLGRFAEDTLGNAAEAKVWAQANGFDRVIVVTDDFHIPRALIELRIAMPNVEFIPYPVKTRLAGGGVWRQGLGSASGLAQEFVKYSIVVAREQILAAETEAEAQAAAPTS